MKIVKHYCYKGDIPKREKRIYDYKYNKVRQGTVIIDNLPTKEDLLTMALDISHATWTFNVGVFVSNPRYDFSRKKGLKWATEEIRPLACKIVYLEFFQHGSFSCNFYNYDKKLDFSIEFENDKRPRLNTHNLLGVMKYD